LFQFLLKSTKLSLCGVNRQNDEVQKVVDGFFTRQTADKHLDTMNELKSEKSR